METPERTHGASPASKHVTRIVEGLQRDLDNPARQASARARLAQLRHAYNALPGMTPQIFSDEYLEVFDYDRGVHDEPTRSELAAHLTLCLFAFYQQSKNEELHVRGISLSKALHNAVYVENSAAATDALDRRYRAVLRAQGWGAISYHLRSLFSQMSKLRPLPQFDFGKLTRDLTWLQYPEYEQSVRLQWARDYSGFRADTSETVLSGSETSESSN